jgi:hypothetical protein
MDNLHYFSGLKMSEAKDFRLHKKNLLVWNVLVMNDLNRTIRLTVRKKHTNEHMYFKCNVMSVSFWYNIFIARATKKRKVKLYLVTNRDAWATHNMHLFPRETFVELASVTCCRKCNVGRVHDRKNVQGPVYVSPKSMRVSVVDAVVPLRRNGRYDIVRKKNGRYKANLLCKHAHL